MSKHAGNRHKCRKQQECVCEQLNELTMLYEELRCLRKQATAEAKANKKQESAGQGLAFKFRMSEAEACVVESSICAASLSTLRQQRDQVRGLVATLRQLSERVAGQEEESCQLEKEIADLQAQLCAIERKIKEKNCREAETAKRRRELGQKNEEEEEGWTEKMTAEAREQANFLAVIKETKSIIESRKASDESEDERRRELRKSNDQLLLNAVGCITKHVEESKSLMSKKSCL